MTGKEERELNEWLATEVMGWHCDDGLWWRNTEHKIVMAFDSWNPYYNIYQCFEYLVPKVRFEKWKWFELSHRPNGLMCNCTGDPKDNKFSDTPEAAICLAVKRAWEGK